MDISIEKIVKILKNHGVSEEKAKEVYDAYLLAEFIHREHPPRETGEAYIYHPLNVALNILNMEIYDPDTISAALLHDTIEDASFEYRKQDIAQSINPTVAELVDGVTKMKGMDFSNKEAENAANTRKIINGLSKDIRIIIIKLADRLHNMRTMQKKKPVKQKENAKETLDIFVPMAIKIGAYQTKNELEDLSLRYLKPEVYKAIKERREAIIRKEQPALSEMAKKIQEELDKKGIKNSIVFRCKSINNIYKEINDEHKKIDNIYDVSYFKVLVEDEDDCYIALGVIHRLYTPINERFKDYFKNPRGFYQSLHTTIKDESGNDRKIKVRTFDMDKRDAYGLISDLNKGRTIEDIQKEFREKWFNKKLQEIDATFKDNTEFVNVTKTDLLVDEIYVYGPKGGITIPKGSTALDFVCEVYSLEELKNLTSIVVNGIDVAEPFNQKLKNNDSIKVIFNGKVDGDDWSNSVTTEKAKIMIKRMNEENNTDK